MTENSNSQKSFAEVALAGEDERRRADQFARPARVKFWRHLALFLVVNLALGVANAVFLPDHRIFFYLTIVWAFILADNFIWAFVVDPDRDVHERKVLQEQRERRRSANEN
jgi:hypothetical protein